MGNGGGERAQSIQIGAVLLFGVLVIALGVFQATVVPQQNGEIEFNSYQDASEDMQQLRTELVRAGSGGRGGVTVETGVRYPARLLAINPGPPSGSLRLSPTAEASISNGVAADEDEVNDYWDGSTVSADTRRVEFGPDYNRFEGSPVVASGTVAYRETGSQPVVLAGQSLVRGNRLNMVAVDGELDTAGQSVSLTAEPLSVSTRTTTLRPSGDPDGDGQPELVVTVPTELSASVWENELLVDQLTSNGGYVEEVRDVTVSGQPAVEVLLSNEAPDGSQAVYEATLSKVEVTERGDDGVVDAPEPAYVVDRSGDGTAIATGQSVTLTAEVRDELGNPESGVEVTFYDTEDDTALGTATTGSEGQVRLAVTPSSSRTVVAHYGGYDPTASPDPSNPDAPPCSGPDGSPECASFEVSVATPSGGGGGGPTRSTLLESTFDGASDLDDTAWEGFDNGTTGVSGAEQNGDSGQSAFHNGDGDGGLVMRDAVDTSGADRLAVELWAQEGQKSGSGPERDEDETLTVQYLDANDDWTTLDTLQPDQSADGKEFYRRFELANADALHAGFKLRVVTPADATSDRWFIDDVRIEAVSASGGGAAPTVDSLTTSSPADGELTVDWVVSDPDSNLNRVVVEVEDSAGNTVRSDTFGASGSSDDDSVTYTGLPADTYDISFAVVDTNSNSDSARRSQSVSSGGSISSPPMVSSLTTDSPDDGELRVDWEVRDPDDDLSQVKLAVTDSGGNEVRSGTFSPGSSPSSDSVAYTGLSEDTYDVELTVSDSNGNTDTATSSQTVTTNDPPTVSSLTTTNPNSGELVVDWTVDDTDGNLDQVDVEITDSNGNTDTRTVSVSGSSNSDSVTFSGLAADTYDVRLTVTDTDGDSDSTSRSQQVTTSGGGAAPSITSFTTKSPGKSGKIEVSWDVNDRDNDFSEVEIIVRDSNDQQVGSATSSQGSGTEDFTGLDSGTYDITLTARDGNGNENSETKSQEVQSKRGGGSGNNNSGGGNGNGGGN